MLKCERTNVPPGGMVLVSEKDNGGVFRWSDDRQGSPRRLAKKAAAKAPTKAKKDKQPRKVFPTPEAAAARYRSCGKSTGQWDYLDADGQLAMRVFRFPLPPDPAKPDAKPAKQFRPVSRVQRGWVLGDPEGPILLNRLPELLAAPEGSRVIVVEGERKCDAARAMGWVVTASAHGSGGAAKSDWSPVRGQHVVILIDRDETGEKYGKAVAALAYAAGALSVRIVRLWELWPEMPQTGDIVDLIEHRRNDLDVVRAQVEGLMDRATEEPRPQLDDLAVFDPVSAVSLMRQHAEMRPPVIEGLLRQGEVANIVAAPKIGKTWLVHSLAGAIVSGGQWLGKKAKKGSVLLIDGELHPETLAERMRIIQRSAGLSDTDMALLNVVSMRGQCVDVNRLGKLLNAKVSPGQYMVVILDALYRFLPGDCEENSNEGMMRVYNALDAIAREIGASVVVVHHSSKGSQSAKAVTDVGAGGGAQSRAADTHMVLRDHEVDGAVVVDAAVRSFAPLKSFVVRSAAPGWELAPDLDPKKLRKRVNSASRADNNEIATHTSLPETRTPEWFAREVVGDLNLIKDAVIRRAKTTFSMKKSEAETLLKCAKADELVSGVPAGLNQPLRYNAVGTTGSKVTPGGKEGGGRGVCVPPTPPRAQARGVKGTETPPPLSSQASKSKTAERRNVRLMGSSAVAAADTLGGAA